MILLSLVEIVEDRELSDATAVEATVVLSLVNGFDFAEGVTILPAFGEGVFVATVTGALWRAGADAFMVSTTVYWLPSFCLVALVLTF